MKVLTCKLCSHKASDLVSHIETKHATETTLEAYMAKFGGIDSVLAPELQKDEDEEVKPAAAAPAEVTIVGVKMAKRMPTADALAEVPRIDPAYEFQEELTKRFLLAVNKSKHVLLVGHTGTGKTSLVEQIAARINQPSIRVNLNMQTTYADMIGAWTVQNGEMVWIDGVLPHAMRNGYWLILDEVDYGEANILCALNPVLEKRPHLRLKEKNREQVPVHPNFRVFGTANAAGAMKAWRHLYQGTNLMNEAWMDRWTVFLVDYMNEALEAKVLSNAIAKVSINVAKELVKIAGMVRKAFVEETVECTFSTRRLLDWAEATIDEVLLSGEDREVKAEAPIRAAQYTVFNKISREDAMAIEGMMRRVLMGRETR